MFAGARRGQQAGEPRIPTEPGSGQPGLHEDGTQLWDGGFLVFPVQQSSFAIVFPRTTKSTQTNAAQILYPAVIEPIKERVAIFYCFFTVRVEQHSCSERLILGGG